MRVKISKKGAKETRYWLNLITTNNNQGTEKVWRKLLTEVTELMKIWGSILEKSK